MKKIEIDMVLQNSLGQNYNEKIINKKYNIFSKGLQINLGLQQQLIFLVVSLSLGLQQQLIFLAVSLHLGFVKYVCYHLLEGIH